MKALHLACLRIFVCVSLGWMLLGCYPARTSSPTFDGALVPLNGPLQEGVALRCPVSEFGSSSRDLPAYAKLEFLDADFSLVLLFENGDEFWADEEKSTIAAYWLQRRDRLVAGRSAVELVLQPAASVKTFPLKGKLALAYRDNNRFSGEIDLENAAEGFGIRGTIDSNTSWELDFTPLGILTLMWLE